MSLADFNARQKYVFFVHGKGFERKTLFQKFSVPLHPESGIRFLFVKN